MGLVIVDVQHAGKPDKLADLGAHGDLNHDSMSSMWEQEAVLTSQYGLAAEVRLRELGHAVIRLSDGRYSDRHNRANAYAKGYTGRVAYTALHLNAGGGAYGLIGYDHRSKAGPSLASSVGSALQQRMTELASVKTAAAAPDNAWSNMYNTIAGIFDGRAVGICYEPCFIDGPHAADMLSSTGLQRIGTALAEGIHTWLTA